MIVEPDFLNHWKTNMLIELLGDETAPLCVIRLWAHCQQRREWRFEGLSEIALKSICRSKSDAKTFFEAMRESGFIRVEGETVIAHDWELVNSSLVRNWNNGVKGGRPSTNNPEETQRKPRGNPAETQTEPSGNPTESEKRREDKNIPPNPLKGGKVRNLRIPVSDEGKILHELYRRRPGTEWSEKEVKAFKKLHPIDPDEFDLVVDYTRAQMEIPGGEGFHRRNLLTFLNNYKIEIDKARDWETSQSNRIKPKSEFIGG